jgi:hypothetical protein
MAPQRAVAWMITLAVAVTAAGCSTDGHFSLLGYTTAPNHDDSIHTVYVPIFENVSFRRGLEFDLTRAVVREIEAKTPYKVANCREEADTELLGKIVNRRKATININQLGELREGEVVIAVELSWRDLRSGEILSRPDKRLRDPQLSPLDARLDEMAQARALERDGKPAPIVLLLPTAHYIPELGGSVTSAEKQLVDRLAVQIVSMMERPW